jgi:hypothetical protein
MPPAPELTALHTVEPLKMTEQRCPDGQTGAEESVLDGTGLQVSWQ